MVGLSLLSPLTAELIWALKHFMYECRYVGMTVCMCVHFFVISVDFLCAVVRIGRGIGRLQKAEGKHLM